MNITLCSNPFCFCAEQIHTQISMLPIANVSVLATILILKGRYLICTNLGVNIYIFQSQYKVTTLVTGPIAWWLAGGTSNANYDCINVTECTPPVQTSQLS